MALPAEPAAPQERRAHNLPPKSYAEAAEEALSPQSADLNEREVLNLPPRSYAEACEGAIAIDSQPEKKQSHKAKLFDSSQPNGRITIATDEDREQYESIGEDDSPRSPDRRRSSVKSIGSIGRKPGAELETEVFEKHQNGTGMPLTSVKVSGEYEKNNSARDGPRVRESTLMSGRQAGAGWQKSRYAFCQSY